MRTILDIKSGKAEPWARLQTAAYSLTEESPELEFIEDGHIYQFRGSVPPSVTGILKAEGFIDTSFYNEYGRMMGQFVHKATYLDDQGELDEESLDPVIAPYVEAWRRFRRESGFTPIVSEKPRINIDLFYCGTPDVIGEFPSGSLTRGVVELRNDGTYKLIPHKDHADIEIWRSIMAVYNWKKNNLKGGK
jgi:hypothetical protein